MDRKEGGGKVVEKKKIRKRQKEKESIEEKKGKKDRKEKKNSDGNKGVDNYYLIKGKNCL